MKGFENVVKFFLFKIGYLNKFQSSLFNPSSFVTSIFLVWGPVMCGLNYLKYSRSHNQF